MQKSIPTALLFQNIITNIENNRLIKFGEMPDVKIIRYSSSIPFLFGSSVDFVNDDAVWVYVEIWIHIKTNILFSNKTLTMKTFHLANCCRSHRSACIVVTYYCYPKCCPIIIQLFKVYLKKLMKITANTMFSRKYYAFGVYVCICCLTGIEIVQSLTRIYGF